MGATRNPSVDLTPLDLASFYVEELKYGPGRGAVEAVSTSDLVAELEALLRDAGVTSMTGAELERAMHFYGDSLGRSFGCAPVLALSCFIDGVMHGIAFAAGLQGDHRSPRT